MNSVNLIGRFTKDPELKFSQSGKAVMSCMIAVDRNMGKEQKATAQSEGKPTADFLRVIAFDKQAETISNFMQKGDMIGIIGKIQTGSYKTATGEMKYTTDIIIEKFDFMPRQSMSESKEPSSAKSNSNNLQDDFAAIEDDEDIPF